jgi:uncharacterized membrane protein
MLRKYINKKDLFGEKDFKWRGGDVSRLESLVDGVFAIAVTLLIVSRDVPATFEQFISVMWSFVGFAVTFTFLFMIWKSHYIFHRRYGLEDNTTIFLNSILIFLILFYIYPLKFLATVLIGEMLLNWVFGLNVDTNFTGHIDMRSLMLIYSSGYLMLQLIMGALYKHAYNHRNIIELTYKEKSITKFDVIINFIMASYALLSIIIAFFATSEIQIGLSGWIYCGIGPTIFIFYKFLNKN